MASKIYLDENLWNRKIFGRMYPAWGLSNRNFHYVRVHTDEEITWLGEDMVSAERSKIRHSTALT